MSGKRKRGGKALKIQALPPFSSIYRKRIGRISVCKSGKR